MKTEDIINMAINQLRNLPGHEFDLLTLSKPISSDAAVNLAKAISKLSPILGNLIEFNIVEFLNDYEEFSHLGQWKRQDPGFPDTIFEGQIEPIPGFEIKAWFPLVTEITARFKGSQNHFRYNNTYVVLLPWLPSHLIYGKPYILDICIVSARSVAEARDKHYHKPPDYLVLEPEDTDNRTKNLQQTTTNGYKWQGNAIEFEEAEKIVEAWGENAKKYQPTREYQKLLRQLINRFPYRLDTNFAKIDRIVHPDIEIFKNQIMVRDIHGLSIKQWIKLIGKKDLTQLKLLLKEKLAIQEKRADDILL
ncbi:hypothetical protein [Scytonema sp. NUACC26]|uniref:hypothetical protein n=1 Tax=Scytonema sp. NUACC26 TaxID=3140176 RepID=UPI0034DBD955